MIPLIFGVSVGDHLLGRLGLLSGQSLQPGAFHPCMTIHLPTVASMNPPSSILHLPFDRFSGDVMIPLIFGVAGV
jgi:hypothetical protein